MFFLFLPEPLLEAVVEAVPGFMSLYIISFIFTMEFLIQTIFMHKWSFSPFIVIADISVVLLSIVV